MPDREGVICNAWEWDEQHSSNIIGSISLPFAWVLHIFEVGVMNQVGSASEESPLVSMGREAKAVDE